MFDTDIEALDADDILTLVTVLTIEENLLGAKRLLPLPAGPTSTVPWSTRRALPGAERMVCLGGDGTPDVAEFARPSSEPWPVSPPVLPPTGSPTPSTCATGTRCSGPGCVPVR